jgi:hypothetical protein
MDDLEKKLEDAMILQKRIEERMKFLEDNADNLTDRQLEDLANLALGLEEKLFPELDEIKKEMEEKKQSSIQKNSDSSNQNNSELQN